MICKIYRICDVRDTDRDSSTRNKSHYVEFFHHLPKEDEDTKQALMIQLPFPNISRSEMREFPELMEKDYASG